jgi:hypothetical protein
MPVYVVILINITLGHFTQLMMWAGDDAVALCHERRLFTSASQLITKVGAKGTWDSQKLRVVFGISIAPLASDMSTFLFQSLLA